MEEIHLQTTSSLQPAARLSGILPLNLTSSDGTERVPSLSFNSVSEMASAVGSNFGEIAPALVGPALILGTALAAGIPSIRRSIRPSWRLCPEEGCFSWITNFLSRGDDDDFGVADDGSTSYEDYYEEDAEAVDDDWGDRTEDKDRGKDRDRVNGKANDRVNVKVNARAKGKVKDNRTKDKAKVKDNRTKDKAKVKDNEGRSGINEGETEDGLTNRLPPLERPLDQHLMVSKSSLSAKITDYYNTYHTDGYQGALPTTYDIAEKEHNAILSEFSHQGSDAAKGSTGANGYDGQTSPAVDDQTYAWNQGINGYGQQEYGQQGYGQQEYGQQEYGQDLKQDAVVETTGNTVEGYDSDAQTGWYNQQQSQGYSDPEQSAQGGYGKRRRRNRNRNRLSGQRDQAAEVGNNDFHVDQTVSYINQQFHQNQDQFGGAVGREAASQRSDDNSLYSEAASQRSDDNSLYSGGASQRYDDHVSYSKDSGGKAAATYDTSATGGNTAGSDAYWSQQYPAAAQATATGTGYEEDKRAQNYYSASKLNNNRFQKRKMNSEEAVGKEPEEKWSQPIKFSQPIPTISAAVAPVPSQSSAVVTPTYQVVSSSSSISSATTSPRELQDWQYNYPLP
ncbi:unnamed protein product [Cyprideis torosa]|uniref:Uncharacterized protein n=1 Tax=Cyprideis torosa TaxID=163714 RepID=A0A7R8W5N6_9CRUS|nr:unnamed protein product [Cyprideis torosa]CAG0884504.1 unnamed protein product [Cyprideis torosa]